MKKIKVFSLDEPWLYLLGLFVFYIALQINIPLKTAAFFLFWWFLICSITVGGYIILCNLGALIVAYMDKSAPSGWNLENRPSIQEIKKKDPLLAQAIGEIWDEIDQNAWKDIALRLIIIVTIFVSLPLSAYLLVSAAEVFYLWKMILSFFTLIYGLLMYHLYI